MHLCDHITFAIYIYFYRVSINSPVPSYNWTRRGSGLPRNALLSNYNRVITIKNVTINDQGEYTCRATNSRLFIEGSVQLRIQAAPDFTIPIGDKHMDKDADLVWICEAFGIPDVSYQWYRDGRPLTRDTLPQQDVGRYVIQDNVLSIRQLDEERDAGMYQCRANNSLAAKYSSGQLRVLRTSKVIFIITQKKANKLMINYKYFSDATKFQKTTR